MLLKKTIKKQLCDQPIVHQPSHVLYVTVISA